MEHQPGRPNAWVDRETALKFIREMSEEDLLFLNEKIVERLKLISQAQSTAVLSQFSVGQRVRFLGRDGQAVVGTIIRLNKKTVSISSDNGQRWNVSPNLVQAHDSRTP